jgi:hypothetical protein
MGDAEIGEHRLTVVGKEDVPGLDISMKDARAVRVSNAPAIFTPTRSASD